MALKVTTDEVRRTVRTTIAVLLTLAGLVPVLVEVGVLDEQRWPWVGLIVAGAAAVTRVMQTPAFDELLRKLGVPSLARDGARVVPGEVVDPAPAEDLEPGGSVHPDRLE